jgi:hypothetical protein
MIFSILALVFGIGSLICFILVIVKMFQHGDTTPAILSLVLILCGIGPLIAFVYGWIKAGAYGIQNIMIGWTGCILGGIICNVLAAVTASQTTTY